MYWLYLSVRSRREGRKERKKKKEKRRVTGGSWGGGGVTNRTRKYSARDRIDDLLFLFFFYFVYACIRQNWEVHRSYPTHLASYTIDGKAYVSPTTELESAWQNDHDLMPFAGVKRDSRHCFPGLRE